MIIQARWLKCLNSVISPRILSTLLFFIRSSAMPYFVISTFGMVRNSTYDFKGDNDGHHWDYVVIDEGHNIKNHSSQINQCCHTICRPQTRRLLLTGTPIMNNLEVRSSFCERKEVILGAIFDSYTALVFNFLQELWSVFDWATSRKVLGDLRSFKRYYAKPIEAARDKFASQREIEHGQRVNEELQGVLSQYFLQRLKVDYLMDRLPKKTEVVVWTHLSKEQRNLYEDFTSQMCSSLTSPDEAEEDSKGGMKVLEAITWLKKLCGHPLLIQDGDSSLDNDSIVNQSAKLKILLHLVSALCSEDHRILVFSQSTKMLDVIESVLQGLQVSRIDGQTKEKDRQRLVDEFNDLNSSQQVMLLSTKAAGVGLTLCGADRVVIYDPSWTPAEDSQAVDRCYRIGQTREVVCYRLIAAGTVEEKMYEKQIHKDGIRRTVFTTGESIQRYFVRDELSKLLSLGAPGECETIEKLKHVQFNPSEHSFVLTHEGVVGISRHDGFYQPIESVDGETTGPRSAFPSVSTPAPKVKGRSQRVLEKENSDDRKPAAAGPNLKAKPQMDIRKKPLVSENTVIIVDSDDESVRESPGTRTAKTTHLVPAFTDKSSPAIFALNERADDDDDDDDYASYKTGDSYPGHTFVDKALPLSTPRPSKPPVTPKSGGNAMPINNVWAIGGGKEEDLSPMAGEGYQDQSNVGSEATGFDPNSPEPTPSPRNVVADRILRDLGNEGKSPALSVDKRDVLAQISTRDGDEESSDSDGSVHSGDSDGDEVSVATVVQARGGFLASYPVTEIISLAEETAARGQPKRALGFLTDVLEYRKDELDEETATPFHRLMAEISASLGLLE